MKELTISEKEAGQRLDKFLRKYLPQAGDGFLYRMLRKKNIVLNGKKASGGEKIAAGDQIRLFLSDDTIAKFRKREKENRQNRTAAPKIAVIYEDSDILLMDKPAGLLSQKAEAKDVSAVEAVTAYLLETGSLKEEELATFRPAVCNRLDRNTSGILAAGKTLSGLQFLTELFRTREVGKYYHCLTAGRITEEQMISGYLIKEAASNTVRIAAKDSAEASAIQTAYRPLRLFPEATLLEVHLITGKTHQIRAHLASVGHPILGDRKYGKQDRCRRITEELHIPYQLLHAGRLVFPKLEGRFAHLSEQEFVSPDPVIFEKTERRLNRNDC